MNDEEYKNAKDDLFVCYFLPYMITIEMKMKELKILSKLPKEIGEKIQKESFHEFLMKFKEIEGIKK